MTAVAASFQGLVWLVEVQRPHMQLWCIWSLLMSHVLIHKAILGLLLPIRNSCKQFHSVQAV